ncbi:MAG: hypothetical protein EBZ59_13430, partial [Planctomycetia bacterium]|nr:hypothetical protein [Planctomycetia bacterium]
MRFLRTLPLAFGAGLLTAAVFAADPPATPGVDPSLYGSLAQNQTGGSPPVMANVPQEDAYQLRGLPPQEAAEEVEETPNRYLETQFLKDRGIATYGWIDAGIGAN